ncbi:alkaline phosphatase family protein [Mucilaginibacter sp. SP1R1]|uniref:alkaline phosphatase family protein n=1 Tax=Mucilaginibacter sp. SP1R1 TaxID=2723091 RepID=UPI001805900F|nr:alkaline phosphatase family protein [Mucilaginibacter sp. SP1R1]MBB6149945.1 putative AlkP superfamily pyrophosphatase or phosphodiesterase [Mucilaginibacter sp. SP1R1]
MKKLSFIAILIFFTSINVFGQRVVIIGLDGFSSEGFKTAKHPNIDKMVADGVLSLTTRPVMPSVTLPNWTSHLTGSGPEEHGVTGNDWTLEKHQLKAIDEDQDGYYPSIFKVLKEQVPGVKTAFYYNWAELINTMNKKYLDEVSFEENDGYVGNYQKALDFIVKYKKDPALIFLYSVRVDHAGHKYKWMSAEYIAAIEEADVAIGKFLDSLKAQNLYKSTHFMLITDHGGTGNGHGGTSMSEMQVPWAITGPKIRRAGLLGNFYNSNKNTSMVIAHIFGVKTLPGSWTGMLPEKIFK